MRTYGRLVLAGGVVAAVLTYWVTLRQITPGLDDSNALGYSRAMNSQMARLMGHFGVLMMGWDQSLSSPAGKAVIVLAIAALFAAYFFRVASVLEHEQREAERGERRANG
jgi:hypothetical protein